jgi:hypothetical protein
MSEGDHVHELHVLVAGTVKVGEDGGAGVYDARAKDIWGA